MLRALHRVIAGGNLFPSFLRISAHSTINFKRMQLFNECKLFSTHSPPSIKRTRLGIAFKFVCVWFHLMPKMASASKFNIECVRNTLTNKMSICLRHSITPSIPTPTSFSFIVYTNPVFFVDCRLPTCKLHTVFSFIYAPPALLLARSFRHYVIVIIVFLFINTPVIIVR